MQGNAVPIDGPPLDHEPVYASLHPVRKGLAAAWGVIGAVALIFGLPLIIITGAASLVWWEVMDWLTRNNDDGAETAGA